MWRRLPDSVIKERSEAFEQKKGIPRIAKSIIATLLFAASLYGISHLNDFFPGAKIRSGEAFNLHNASALSLISVFFVTVLFMYFLLVKNRKPPVIFVCYACQEAFHAQQTCPACNSAHVSDIRFAEWVEDTESPS